MKKKLVVILGLILMVSGCSQVTQSSNTKSLEKAETTEAQPENYNKEASMSKILPSSPINKKYLKSNKTELELNEILAKMKDLLKIGDNYGSIKTYEYDDINTGKTYNVNYEDKNTSSSLWYTVDAYGNLINYGRYSEDEYNKATASDEAGLENVVLEFIKKLYGDVAEEFEITENKNINSLESTTRTFNVKRKVNDIVVPGDNIQIEVSKGTKNIVSFSLNTQTNPDFSDTSYFENKEGTKGEEELKDKYKETNKIYKSLLSVANYEKLYATLKYFPVYGLFGNQIPINAKNLEPNYIQYSPIAVYDVANAKEAAGDLNSVEQEHVDDVKSQHTAKEAETKARELFNLGNEYKLNYSSFYNYNQMKGIYVWNLSFEDTSSNSSVVSLLGKDLSLISYSDYRMEDDSKEIMDYNVEELVKISDSFVKEKASMKLEDLEKTVLSENTQYGPTHTGKYIRKVNDQYIYKDVITVEVSKSEKRVTQFNKNWDFEFKDEKLNFKIDEDEAYKILEDTFGFRLVYKRDYLAGEEKPVKLYYELNNENIDYNGALVNGETSEVIDINGKKVSIRTKLEYSDIDQAENPEIIKKLAENNIGFTGGELKPKEEINQIGLFRIFASNYVGDHPDNLTDEEIYKTLSFLKILGDEKEDPKKIVTQRDYAKYVSRIKNYEKIAKLNDIFKDKYTDIDSSDPDFGYLVLGKEKGFIKTDGEDKLNPNKKINRETALYYYYNLRMDKDV